MGYMVEEAETRTHAKAGQRSHSGKLLFANKEDSSFTEGMCTHAIYGTNANACLCGFREQGMHYVSGCSHRYRERETLNMFVYPNEHEWPHPPLSHSLQQAGRSLTLAYNPHA